MSTDVEKFQLKFTSQETYSSGLNRLNKIARKLSIKNKSYMSKIIKALIFWS